MWPYYAVLFISSACIMTLELVAGRVAAPYIGVSLYTWTGIIAAVLAGMSAGNLLGGRLADRIPPRLLLGWSLVASAILAAAILPLARPLLGSLVPQGGPPLISIFLPSLLLFGIPCFALAVISPAVYKLVLRDLNRLGGTVGRLAASGILGSILGTYATGFYLIPAMGVRAIVLSVAAALLLLGLVVLVRLGGIGAAVQGQSEGSPAPARSTGGASTPAKTARGASTPAKTARGAAAPAQPLGIRAILAIAFMASAAIMAIELVGGRLLAPTVGTNLYTWTAIIGAVLLGMTLGGLAGGYLADRSSPGVALGLVLAWAGAVCGLIVLGGVGLLGALLPNAMPPLLGISLPTMALLLPPSLLLGAAAPLCYKLAIADTAHVGRTAGALGAAGALGSITGTLAAGYWLVPTFGSLATAFGVSMLLAVVAAVLLWRHNRVARLPALMAVVLLIQVAVQPGQLSNPNCDVESVYFCIRVDDIVRPDTSETVRMLVLDRLIHSGYNMSRPDELWYGYEQAAAWILQSWGRPNLKSLYLGGGGYLMPYWTERHLAGSAADVAEIDPEVTRIALRDFVPNARRIRTYPGDARMVLATLPPVQRYDAIIGDAFTDVSVPYHLTTLEFGRMVRDRLTPGGMYIVNIVDRVDGDFLPAYAHTLAQVFPQVYVLPGEPEIVGYSTFVVVATDNPLPWTEWKQRLAPPFDITEVPLTGQRQVLTDDYVPVDNLLLPLFNLRWEQ